MKTKLKQLKPFELGKDQQELKVEYQGSCLFIKPKQMIRGSKSIYPSIIVDNLSKLRMIENYFGEKAWVDFIQDALDKETQGWWTSCHDKSNAIEAFVDRVKEGLAVNQFETANSVMNKAKAAVKAGDKALARELYAKAQKMLAEELDVLGEEE